MPGSLKRHQLNELKTARMAVKWHMHRGPQEDLTHIYLHNVPSARWDSIRSTGLCCRGRMDHQHPPIQTISSMCIPHRSPTKASIRNRQLLLNHNRYGHHDPAVSQHQDKLPQTTSNWDSPRMKNYMCCKKEIFCVIIKDDPSTNLFCIWWNNCDTKGKENIG